MVWKPRTGKWEHQADLFGNWQKFLVMQFAGANGVTHALAGAGADETWGGITAELQAIPADSGLIHDRLGGLLHYAINPTGTNTTRSAAFPSGSGTPFNVGTPVRIILPYPRRVCTIKTVMLQIYFLHNGDNAVSGTGWFDMTIKAVKADTSSRTLGTVSLTGITGSSAALTPGVSKAVIRFTTPQQIAADERIIIELQMRGQNGSTSHSCALYSSMISSQALTSSPLQFLEHYEGRFPTAAIEFLS